MTRTFLLITTLLLSISVDASAASSALNVCDTNGDGILTVADVQRAVNEALGLANPLDDLSHDNTVNIVDVQTVVTALLLGSCAGSAPGPGLVSVIPNAGQQGQGLTITVNGSNTAFAQNQTQVSLGAGITIDYVIVTAPSSLTVHATISPGASPGSRPATVTTSQQVVSLLNAFTVTNASTATITSLLPVRGQQGQSLSITVAGQNTSFVDGQTQVSMGAGISVSSVTVGDSGTLLADIVIGSAAALGQRDLRVTTGQQTVTLSSAFTVVSPSAPAITAVTPGSGEAGLTTQVTITGQNTNFAAGQTQVSLDAGITVSNVSVQSPTSLTVQLAIAAAAAAGPRTVTATTGTQIATLPNGFIVTQPSPPSIVALNPPGAPQGQTINVSIGGLNTSFTQALTQVSCGAGISVSSVSVSTTLGITAQFHVAADATLGPRDLIVTTGGQVLTLPAAFFVTTSDTATPAITSLSPTAVAVGTTQTLTIAGTNLGLAAGMTIVTLGDNVAVGNVNVLGLNQLTVDVTPSVAATPGARTITVSTGPNVITLDGAFVITGPPLAVTSPSDLTFVNTPVITVSGQVGDPASTLTINGASTANGNGNFSASVPISEGNNTITIAARSTGGATSTAAIRINLDTTPPHLSITSPPSGYQTADASVTVSGMVNDIVLGTVNDQDATVTVNGIGATVQNRTYSAIVPLLLGTNSLQVVARDRVGNSATAASSVQRLVTTQLRIISGNNQSGPVQGQLPGPLIVELRTALGQPVANASVVFTVTGNDGGVGAQSGGHGKPSVVQQTDSQGRTMVSWTLGSRSGQSNNRVEATSPGVAGAAVFTASATAVAPAKILVDSGTNQSGAAGQPLPLPFIAVVVDAGNNRLAGVPVTFTVQQGGGAVNSTVAKLSGAAYMVLSGERGAHPQAINSNQSSVTVTTDGDGRAAAYLQLGPVEGPANNVVQADFAGDAGAPAIFTATGWIAGDSAQTRVLGVVLDNSGVPLAGVTMRLLAIYQGPNTNLPMDVIPAVQTDSQGQFVMTQAPAGLFKLMADGTTVPGSKKYPTLEFDITNVAGRDNSINSPIFLKELDTVNQLCVSATTGGTLTLPASPGFALTVAPGSVTFPGGSRSGCLSVTPVNMDKIPMAPGFGQQPRFIVTIQPVGAKFDPPAAITIPNVDGLLPRAVTEMYSYDHDLSAFVAIGTGTVSADGLVIQSDPGVGVLKAGWHCGGNPTQSAMWRTARNAMPARAAAARSCPAIHHATTVSTAPRATARYRVGIAVWAGVAKANHIRVRMAPSLASILLTRSLM